MSGAGDRSQRGAASVLAIGLVSATLLVTLMLISLGTALVAGCRELPQQFPLFIVEPCRGLHQQGHAELATADPPMVVARSLNTLIGDGSVWCDGGPFDAYWMDALFDAAGTKPGFMLRSWDGLLRELGDEVSERVRDQLEHAEVRHRAGEDAAMLMEALAAELRPGC